jgi:hypothetical protein
MLYEVCCSSNNKDYVSQLRSDSPLNWNFHYQYTTAKLVSSCLLHYKSTCHFTSLHFSLVLVSEKPSSSSYIVTDSQSASLSLCRAPFWVCDQMLHFIEWQLLFFFFFFFFSHVGRPLWWEDGSVICSAMCKFNFKLYFDRRSVGHFALVVSLLNRVIQSEVKVKSQSYTSVARNFQCYHWEGCMGSMQCNMEFGYQLSICSGTKENPDRFGWSQDHLDTDF